MQAEFNEKLEEFFKSVNKPLADLSELNINTMNKWSKNMSAFEKISHSKKPDELLNAQIELINTTAVEGIKYLQQACNIWLEALSKTSNNFSETAREMNKKTPDNYKANKI